MPGPVEAAAREEIAKAEERIAANQKNYDTQNIPIFFKQEGGTGGPYVLKAEALTEGEQEALALARAGKSFKALVDSNSPEDNPQLKAGGQVATVEWVAAKCKELGC